MTLCAGCHPEEERAARLRRLLAGPLDWTAVLGLARSNGVLAHLSRQVEALAGAGVPEEVRQALRRHYQSNALRNLHLTHELLALLQLLEGEGIAALPYKGPVLALQLYGDPALRQVSDLDILVRETQAERACAVAGQRGFVRQVHLSGPKGDSEYAHRLVHPQSGIAVEVHWGTTLGLFGVRFGLAQVGGRLRESRLAGHRVLCMAPEDQLLALCLHLGKHCWEQRLRLSWAADIAQTVAASPGLEWNALLERARRNGCTRMLLLGLGLAQHLCGCSLPRQVARQAGSDAAVQRLGQRACQWVFAPAAEPAPFDLATFVARTEVYLDLREQRRHRLRYCAHYLKFALRWTVTPNAEDRSRLPLPRAVAFLYYGLRPLRLLCKHAVGGPASLRCLGRLWGPLVRRRVHRTVRQRHEPAVV